MIVARKTKEETEQTYRALLDAAGTLFTRQGVAKTTLVEIAAEASMTRGAIYHHFDNKEMLIKELWERDGEILISTLEKLATQISSSNPVVSFRNAIKELLNMVVSVPSLAQTIRIVVHNVEFTDENTALQQYLTGKKKLFLRSFSEAFKILRKHRALRTSLSTDLLAFSLLSFLYGLIHNHLTPDGIALDLSKAGEDLVDLFLDGILVD